jgi:hypothetical protein
MNLLTTLAFVFVVVSAVKAAAESPGTPSESPPPAQSGSFPQLSEQSTEATSTPNNPASNSPLTPDTAGVTPAVQSELPSQTQPIQQGKGSLGKKIMIIN